MQLLEFGTYVLSSLLRAGSADAAEKLERATSGPPGRKRKSTLKWWDEEQTELQAQLAQPDPMKTSSPQELAKRVRFDPSNRLFV